MTTTRPRPTATASPPPPPQPPAPAGTALSRGGGEPPAGIDWRRYRKLRWFVAKTFLQAFVHDVVLARPALRWARREPLARWQEVARRYRSLAVEMGGVLIKLGQFLSIRVDLLPPEVTRELAGLQDEVPAEPFAAVTAQIAEDFGRPAGEVFAALDPTPLGSASLAQVHAARLPDGADAGRDVVVKVLRPGIARVVETDLAAIRLAVRLLRPWRQVRRRVDLDRLAAEITDTTRAELDLAAEGLNAERFARDFAGDERVRIPRVFWEHSAAHTLTLENVAFVKIADHAALDAAGVSRAEVAKALYRVYMRQIFVHDFVHADPHPGNLFVRPLPWPGGPDGDGGAAGDGGPGGDGGDAAEAGAGRPFELVFVDFGMVASIPQRLRAALREYLFALGTRDAERMVHAYQAAGVLLPGADLRRLVEIHEDLFQRFWGVRIGELRQAALAEARYFLREYRDLLFELPFQVQVDLLFVSRAVGLLSGITTSLDPRFDPWAETLPFAEQLAAEELSPGVSGWLKLVAEQAALAARLPEKLDRVLTRAERGSLSIHLTVPPELRRSVERLERLTQRLGWLVVATGLLISAVVLRSAQPGDPLTPWLFGAAALALGWGILRGR